MHLLFANVATVAGMVSFFNFIREEADIQGQQFKTVITLVSDNFLLLGFACSGGGRYDIL